MVLVQAPKIGRRSPSRRIVTDANLTPPVPMIDTRMSRVRRWVPWAIAAVIAIAIVLVLPSWTTRLVAVAVLVALVAGRRQLAAYYAYYGSALVTGLRQRTGQSLYIAIPTFAFLILFVWILLNVLIRPIFGPSPYDTPTVSLLVCGIALLLPPATSACAVITEWFGRRPRWNSVIAVCGIFAIILVAQLVLAVAVTRFPGWDAGELVTNAINLADGADEINTAYFNQYPFNIALTLVLWKFMELSRGLGLTDDLVAASILNALVLFAGTVVTYLAARKLVAPSIALLTLIPTTAFIAFSPWINTAYSDTFALVFTALLLYLFLLLGEAPSFRRKTVVWAAIGICAGLGSAIKITVLIGLIAIVLVVVVQSITKREGWKTVGATGLAIVIAGGCVVGVGQVVKLVETQSGVVAFDLYTNDREFPLTHFLKMGAQGLGGYNQEDVNTTVAIPTKSERSEAALQEYLRRVAALGPAGYSTLLTDKATWSLGDGTFYQSGEGGSTDSPFVSTDRLSVKIQSFFDIHGSNHWMLVLAWQPLWILMLLLIAAPLFMKDRRLFSDPASVLRFALLGLLLYVMFFENRSRYLYLYVPFFILLASLSLDSLRRTYGKARSALRPSLEDRHGRDNTGTDEPAGMSKGSGTLHPE